VYEWNGMKPQSYSNANYNHQPVCTNNLYMPIQS